MVGIRLIGLCLVLAAYSVLVDGPALATLPPEAASPASMKRVTATMMEMPLQFEANHGQVDAQVKFLARGKGYTLFLTPTESVMVLSSREASHVKRAGAKPPLSDPPAVTPHAPREYQQSVVRMRLEGANPSPAIEGIEQLPGIVNYFIGNNPAKWHRDVPTYAKVQYQQAYPGIDLAYYGNQGKLEYDFIVAPGADPNQIKLAFEGASDIRVADSGDLLLTTTLGEVHLQKPVVYQLEPNGHKTLVAGQYVVRADRLATFDRREVQIQLAAYDPTKPLVIDPVLLFSTYLGGNGADAGTAIAVDANRNMYVTGMTTSTDFPILNAAQGSRGGGPQDVADVFVTKLNANGSLAYSTYLGGSGFDNTGYGRNVIVSEGGGFPGGIAVDIAGNAYVAGTTQSGDFPTLNAYQTINGGPTAQGLADDAFVTKLGPTGALLYSTYLGYASTDYGFDVAVDAQQNAYVTGQTGSQDFPIFNTNAFLINLGLGEGYPDAFVTKFNSTGGLVYSRFFGGGLGEFAPYIAADGLGNVYLTGQTNTNLFFASTGADQEAFGGDIDAFVAKLDPAGNTLWCTYLGGGGREMGYGIAVDESGNVYVTGDTTSTNFPTLNASQPIKGDLVFGQLDAFVAKYSSTGVRVYSTYLGGGSYDTGNGIAADAAGNAYVTGLTGSGNFPVLNASQPAYGGGLYDAFVTKFSAAGARLYSTYLGGEGSETGFGIAVDTAGNAYVSGEGGSSNFPLVNPNLPSPPSFNAFVTKLGEPITNDPPVCTSALPSIASLWKADRSMVPVSISGISDSNSDPITITYPSVTQDEPVSGLDKRDLSPDAVVSGQQILLRAERDQKGDGRVYAVQFTATDGQGGSCSGNVQVQVPLNKKNSTAVNSGQTFNSFGP